MKTATVRQLRNDFARLSKWLEKGESVQIVKRGKPFARVVPEPKTKSFLGCMNGTANIPDDFDEPLDLEWEAMKGDFSWTRMSGSVGLPSRQPCRKGSGGYSMREMGSLVCLQSVSGRRRRNIKSANYI